MKVSILRARYALEMDCDMEVKLGITNIAYNHDKDGVVQGCTIYTEETFDAPNNNMLGGAVYYIVLDRELLKALEERKEVWDE